MSSMALYLILASIFMHSLWHFLCKSSGKPSMAFFAVFSTSLFITISPLALSSNLIGTVPFSIVKYAIAGGISGVICDIGLIWAYRYCDISLAYPMARALPVLFTMVATSCFGWGKTLSVLAILGMIIIFAGCIIMAFSSGAKDAALKEKLLLLKKGLIGILIAALGTTSYTIVDKFGVDGMVNFAPNVSKLQAAGTYSCIREFFAMITMWLLVFIRHLQGKDKGYLTSLVKQYHPYCAGFFAALAYVVILVAMNHVTNVSFVQAFRQLSLPLSAFLGYFILKEKITLIRWIGLSFIMAGLILSVF